MNYKITFTKFRVNSSKLTIAVYGEIFDKRIKIDSYYMPKIQLFFENEKEDRVLPFPLKEIKYENGKCKFKCEYVYDLEYIFYETRKEYMPFKLYFNFKFLENYEQITIEDDILDDKSNQYKCEVLGNFVRFLPNKNIIKIKNFFSSIINFISRLFFSTVLLPIFFIEAIIRVIFDLKIPDEFCKHNKIKKIFVFTLYRYSEVLGKKIDMYHLRICIYKVIYNFYKKSIKIKNNQIAFFSSRREEISGNFKYIYEKMKKDNNLQFVFYLKKGNFFNQPLAEFKKFAIMCAASKVIIIDEYVIPLQVTNLKKEQKLIQIWHATGAFKTTGFSNLSKHKNDKMKQKEVITRKYDFYTVSSESCKNPLAEANGLPLKKVIPTGVPRTDIFFDKDYEKKICKDFFDKYPNFKNKKKILFAPTFRGKDGEYYYQMDMFDLENICEKIPDDYCFIIKHHPFIKEKHFIPEKYRDRVVDFSSRSEINDLLFIADVVITDYSSLIFEAALINKPMIFYTFDYEEYLKSKGFYFDFEFQAPGKIVKTQEELINAIKNEDYNIERLKNFANMFFDHKDGKSTQRVVDLIYDCLK